MEDTIIFAVEMEIGNDNEQLNFFFKNRDEARQFFEKAEGKCNKFHVLHLWQSHEKALEELEEFRKWESENNG